MQYPDPVDFEGHVLRQCVISAPTHFEGRPWDWDECFAGVAVQVLTKIYNLSGLGSEADPEIVRAVEDYLGSTEARFDLVIMTAYNYKLEELMVMDHRDWHMLVGISQMKLEMMEIDTEAILYPERKKQKRGKIVQPGGTRAPGRPDDPAALGGARPFFSGAAPRDPGSPYPAGHPKNPAVVDERSAVVPGAAGEISFFSN